MRCLKGGVKEEGQMEGAKRLAASLTHGESFILCLSSMGS